MKKSVFYEHIIRAALQDGVSVSEILKEAASLGYSGCDLRWESEEKLRDTYEILGAENINVASVYRFWNVFSAVDEDDANRFFKVLSDCGCHVAMVIPWGVKKTDFSEEEFSEVTLNLKKLCSLASNYNITVAVEDFDDARVIINDFKSVKRALEAVDGLYHAFDTGNYAYFHESELDALEFFKHKIKNVHLKDRAFSPILNGDQLRPLADGTPTYACSVGKGDLKIKECIELLSEIGYSGYLSAELNGHLNMRAAIRESAEFVDSVLSKKL